MERGDEGCIRPGPKKWPAQPPASFILSWDWSLSLVDRQDALVQLHDGQIAGGHVDGADHSGRPAVVTPAAVSALGALVLVEDLLAVLRPGDQLVGARVGEELLVAVIAEHIDD